MKRAFSFIELVVAIVVMGIVFLTVPLILSETQKSTELSIQQEAIMAGVTQLVNTMSYRWDENETNESLNGGYAKVLDTIAGDSELQCHNYDNNGSRRRIGHFRESDRRRCYNPARYASTLGPDGGDLDDIDDLIVSGKNLFATTEGEMNGTYEYKRDYSVTLNAYYASDTFDYSQKTITGAISTASLGTMQTQSTNLKILTATIQTAEGDKVVLHAFMPNIGEYKIYHKNVQ